MNTAQTAQTAVNTQAQTNVQSVSGVNLDEEAANLLQWQQAYQASAQALTVAQRPVHHLHRLDQRHIQLRSNDDARHPRHGAGAILDGDQPARIEHHARRRTIFPRDLSFTTASQNPVAAGLVGGYNQVLAQSQQYTTNGNSAQTSLNTEDNALTQMQNQLQSLRGLALEANNGTESQSGLERHRDADAADPAEPAVARQHPGRQRQLHFRRLLHADAAVHAHRHRRDLQRRPGAAAGADRRRDKRWSTGDNGDLVFNQIKNGNGTFNVTAARRQHRNGRHRRDHRDRPGRLMTAARYTIEFTAPDTYKVVESPARHGGDLGHLHRAARRYPSRACRSRCPAQPAAGDSFAVAPSTNQSVFTTVQNLVTALQVEQRRPRRAGAAQQLDQRARSTASIRRSIKCRPCSRASARGSTPSPPQQSVATSQQTQLQQSISNCRASITRARSRRWTRRTRRLSAAMQAYTQTAGLSLFKYLQG